MVQSDVDEENISTERLILSLIALGGSCVGDMGRHTTYTPELGLRICEELAGHPKGLRSLCEENDDFPTPQCIWTWRRRFPDFDEAFTAARDMQLDMMADDIRDVARDDSRDPQERRLIVDTDKWLLSKLRHKTFGDKLDVTSGGEALAAASPTQIDQRIQSIVMLHAKGKLRAATEGLDPDVLKLLD